MIAEWLARRRLRRMVRDHPPLPGRHEELARRLATHGTSVPGGAEVRAIGEELYAEGGVELMRRALLRAQALQMQQRSMPMSIRGAEKTWNGIGDWRA